MTATVIILLGNQADSYMHFVLFRFLEIGLGVAVALASPAADALGRTAASVFELLQVTQQSGQRELQLVQAQEAYVNPRQRFEVAQVR